MPSSNRFLSVTAGHVDALIEYVNDIKPYHTKLRQVVEEYLFEDSINVSVDTTHRFVAFLGADILDPAIYAGSGRKSASSWRIEKISDGARTRYVLPLVSHPKFLSHVGQEKFVCGVNDDDQIPGLTQGAFSQRRWDGPGITRVSKNGEQLHEGEDFVISHGVFSFEHRGNRQWKPLDINDNAKFPVNYGFLRYEDVKRSYGSIVNISSDANQPIYDEWTLECVYVDSSTAKLSVTGKLSGYIGEAEFNVPFSSPQISFLFTAAEDMFSWTLPGISLGDKFVLTPAEKISIHPDAPAETWSLIKVNPRRLQNVTFVPGVPLAAGEKAPDIQIYNRDLHETPESSWEIEFLGSNQFELCAYDTTSALIPGYPKTIDLLDGCSFKDELIHFTLIPSTRGFKVGDKFTFNIIKGVYTYRVFGSLSGWQLDAEIGEWYWNGKIGFKIPPLEYFSVTYTPSIATSIDGSTWTTVVSNEETLTNVQYISNSTRPGFLVTGSNLTVLSSINGQIWQNDIVGLAGDGERSIVIGENGLIAMTTLIDAPPSGVPTYTWYARNSRTTEDLNDITYVPDFFISSGPTNPGLYVVVGDNGTIITSANGDAWTLQTSGTTKNLNSVAWKRISSTALILVAVGDDGTILTSSDALTWSPVSSGVITDLKKVEYYDEIGAFITIGEAGTILRSTDGIIWSNQSISSSSSLLDIAYRPIDGTYPNGLLVIVGSGEIIVTSIDTGFTWNSTVGPQFYSIAWGDGQFVAVGGGAIQADQIVTLANVHPMAEPSVYEIIFLDEDTNYKYAKVTCNLGGIARGLKIDKASGESAPWSDGLIKFKLTDPALSFNRGDVIRIYIAPAKEYHASNIYDAIPYELLPYDTGEYRIPLAYFYEYFPLFHSHGTVILNDCAINDEIIIDKALFDLIRLKLHGSSVVTAPRLAPGINEWIPLDFRYGDRTASGTITSLAHFSDLATTIEAYSATDPDYKIFTLTQPRYKCSNRSEFCLLEFSQDFLEDYLPSGATFTLMTIPQESYGNTIRVKITENFRVYSLVRFNFDEITTITISDQIPTALETTSLFEYSEAIAVAFSENGIIPFLFGYDEFPYDLIGYDWRYLAGQIIGFQEVPPGSRNYVYTGNPADIVNVGTPVQGSAGILIVREDARRLGENLNPNGYSQLPYDTSEYSNGVQTLVGFIEVPPGSGNYVYTGNPADIVYVNSGVQGPSETTGASFTEGLKIVDTGATNRVNVLYDIYRYTAPITPPVPIDGLLIEEQADEYIVTHNYTAGTPFLIVESLATPGVYLNPVPSTNPYSAVSGATSYWSFKFSVPPGTAPFKLRLV